MDSRNTELQLRRNVKMTPILYNIAIEAGDKQHVIDWGNAPGWRKSFDELFKHANRVSLLPKNGVMLPVVTMRGDCFAVFSRVVGRMEPSGSRKEERLYCLKNSDGSLWVYPGGVVEFSDSPTYAGWSLR